MEDETIEDYLPRLNIESGRNVCLENRPKIGYVNSTNFELKRWHQYDTLSTRGQFSTRI